MLKYQRLLTNQEICHFPKSINKKKCNTGTDE